ncbi:Cytochrome oxidase biogenesis protein Sco1/SenC/PrrC, thiol-disulfide reductase involved in Cu(I) insertion into CoxII Cu(A) center [hydrothermal vent metagenome]|uniref:Cytochrome oxidase biogenesis protein Sco1/SenC/PrrC, thiol-disulfide reductase involved in Cu(I) insertion into CoxII Cu(A) center n=1 Tax=hydrothermal vent metagenome TaxID=652676 RepID=A0A3B1CWK0_9ZZZZ
MNMKKIVILSLAFIVGISLAYSIKAFIKETKAINLPVLNEVADFSLIDTEGKIFTKENLKNKVWVASFIFTTCSDICPIMSKNMASLFRSFELLDDVEFISVTVNPENDSPEVLKEYAKRYQAKAGKWHFLTGDRKDIKELVVGSFKMGDIKEPVFHSPKFVLVDKKGYIRGYYDGTNNDELRELFKAIPSLR